MNYRETVAIDPQRAPITHALMMKFQMIDADIAAAPAEERDAVALDGMYAFLGDLILAVHQLEVGDAPEVVAPPED